MKKKIVKNRNPIARVVKSIRPTVIPNKKEKEFERRQKQRIFNNYWKSIQTNFKNFDDYDGAGGPSCDE